MSLAPFGKDVIYKGREVHLVANIIWIIFFGWEMALAHLISACLLCITIVGIPFAKQSLKLAKVSLMPFGYEIVDI
jgi:uncharacterized membrane protein YccF (DUF307 family)